MYVVIVVSFSNTDRGEFAGYLHVWILFITVGGYTIWLSQASQTFAVRQNLVPAE